MMTKANIERTISELCETYDHVGIRFENAERFAGETCNNSRSNDDRDCEREFPEYGTEEYDELPELDGTCAYDAARMPEAIEWAAEQAAEADHAYIIVSDQLGDMSAYMPDEGEILMQDAVVAAIIY